MGNITRSKYNSAGKVRNARVRNLSAGSSSNSSTASSSNVAGTFNKSRNQW